MYGGHDVYAWFPTGYGKSLCYQLLPYMFDVKLGLPKAAPSERSVVLVISPLVSLMRPGVWFAEKRSSGGYSYWKQR